MPKYYMLLISLSFVSNAIHAVDLQSCTDRLIRTYIYSDYNKLANTHVFHYEDEAFIH